MVHQNRVERIANAWALHFGIAHNRHNFRQIGVLIDLHMAYANAAGDHRDGGVFAAELV